MVTVVYDDLSATDERILTMLNYHVIQNDRVSITALADQCSVAKSTIVKLAKKLGYDGFSDLRRDLAQGHRDAVSDTYLPMSITETEDALDDATLMATRFWEHRAHKNVLVASTTSASRLPSSYLARKLSMFNIPAAETYDYATIQPHGATPGIALFFEHNLVPKAERGRLSIYVSQPHFRLANKSGYEIMLVSDTQLSTPVSQLADDIFRIKRTNEPNIDLFIPRVLMLFELMLSELSRIENEMDREKQDSNVPSNAPASPGAST